MTTKTAVTVLGLGPMGHALASTFLTAGHPTTVWNRSPAKAGDLVARGAIRAATPADAAAASDVVVACVLDYAAAREVFAAAAPALGGRSLVHLTSGSPDSARSLADWATGHGVTYVDGAILTPTFTIGTPDAVFLFSGQEEPPAAMASLGGSTTYLGPDPGRAAAYDVALLDIFWTSVAGMTHGFAMARAENITATELAPFAKGIGSLLPLVIDNHACRVDQGRHDGDHSTIASAVAGMSHIIESADARGITVETMRAARSVALRAVEAGHGSDGLSRLTELLGPRTTGTAQR
ncbi:MAG: NAD(P)-dependent oxidoreductase [Actinophytocola sp.]|uniref:NAD(P)-dependent oxidoreductase n=1 Tax=Actinophytocola sp. TaxID=1872138 RepID=UPI001324056F|nr:NAD(P)-binding domain-containing protein [Actinophytocola sp.]MPZ79875.1 NAD(P)-dependent oxidoreductase [Actinophytocola sp.]